MSLIVIAKKFTIRVQLIQNDPPIHLLAQLTLGSGVGTNIISIQ